MVTFFDYMLYMFYNESIEGLPCLHCNLDYDYFAFTTSKIRYNKPRLNLYNRVMPWIRLDLDIFNRLIKVIYNFDCLMWNEL